MRGDEGFGYLELFGGHDLGKGFEAVGGGDVAVGDRAGVPGIGRDIVERQTFAMFIEKGKESLGTRMALLSGQARPVGGLGIVGRDSDPF